MSRPPRYQPARALPPYAFVPGKTPHPVTDPRGHAHGREREPVCEAFDEASWADNPDYLWGVDLYNEGFLWEAHEAWEGLWRTLPRGSRPHLFVQGLIQAAACALKADCGQPSGVTSLAETAIEHLRAAAGDQPLHGIDVPAFTAALASYAASNPPSSAARPLLHLSPWPHAPANPARR